MKKLILSIALTGLLPMSLQAFGDFAPFPLSTGFVPSAGEIASPPSDLFKGNNKSGVIFTPPSGLDSFRNQMGSVSECPQPYINNSGGPVVINPCASGAN